MSPSRAEGYMAAHTDSAAVQMESVVDFSGFPGGLSSASEGTIGFGKRREKLAESLNLPAAC